MNNLRACTNWNIFHTKVVFVVNNVCDTDTMLGGKC